MVAAAAYGGRWCCNYHPYYFYLIVLTWNTQVKVPPPLRGRKDLNNGILTTELLGGLSKALSIPPVEAVPLWVK